MKSVYKYSLILGCSNEFQMPPGKVLHVAGQYGEVTIWVEVNLDTETSLRRFNVVGTGFDIPEETGTYVGTAMIDNFVWHVYEE